MRYSGLKTQAAVSELRHCVIEQQSLGQQEGCFVDGRKRLLAEHRFRTFQTVGYVGLRNDWQLEVMAGEAAEEERVPQLTAECPVKLRGFGAQQPIHILDGFNP